MDESQYKYFMFLFTAYHMSRLQIRSSKVNELKEKIVTVAAALLLSLSVPGIARPTGAMLMKFGSLRAVEMGDRGMQTDQ